MKKIISISLMGILVLSGLGAAALQDNNETNTLFKTANIQLSEPIIIEENNFLKLKLVEDQTYFMSTGKPMIPQIVKTFEFPAGTKIEDTNVMIEWETIELTKQITPSPVPLAMTTETVIYENERNAFDESVYSSTELYPSESYKVKLGSGINNGEQVIYVNVRCYSQYSPANNYIKIPKVVDIDIQYDDSEVPLYTADQYDLLIITHEKFEETLQELVDHKNYNGIRTMMTTVDEIYPAYDGVADWEDIKMYLADVVLDMGIDYVMLAGGHKGQTSEWYVPEFLSNNFDEAYSGSGVPYDLTYGSDLYYADVYYADQYGHLLMDNWDSNGNGIYGEGPTAAGGADIPDYYPNVHLGRAPFRYSWEAEIYVDKVIAYETMSPNPSWFTRALLCGGDTTPPARYSGYEPGVYEGEIACDVTASNLGTLGWDITKAYTSDNGDLVVHDGPEDVYPEFNKGYGWVNMQTHANPAVAGNFYPDAPTEEDFCYFYTIFDVRYFTSGNKLPFMVVDGCHNGQFNVTLQQMINAGSLYYPRSHFLEFSPTDGASWFLLQGGGGGIAGVGNTALGYGYVNTGITHGLGGWISPRFAHAFAIQGKETTGELYSQAITDYIDNFPINTDEVDRKTVEERPLFGDPSIKLGGGSAAFQKQEPENNEETDVTTGKLLAPIEAPVWQKGDSWKFRLDDFSLQIAELEDRAFDIDLKSEDITFEVVDVTASKYRVSISGDDVDVAAGFTWNPYTGNDTISIPKMTLENVALSGMITLEKDTIAFEKVEMELTVDLIENLDNLLPFLGIELPPIVEKLLPYMEIPAIIQLTLDFNPGFKVVEFPIEEGSHWGVPGGEMTVTIDGSVESVWLRILDFVNRFIPLIPAEFAQYLPDIDISEMLSDFGIPTEMTMELPVVQEFFRKPVFEYAGMTTVGSYNTARIKFVHGVLDIFYSPEAKMFAKVEGPFDQFLPIATNLNLELIG